MKIDAKITLRNSKSKPTDILGVGEPYVDYTEETKPKIKVGAADGTGGNIDTYAKCSDITNGNTKISEEDACTFGGMRATEDGIDANGKKLSNLGEMVVSGAMYGTSLPTTGEEGQIFFLIEKGN